VSEFAAVRYGRLGIFIVISLSLTWNSQPELLKRLLEEIPKEWIGSTKPYSDVKMLNNFSIFLLDKTPIVTNIAFLDILCKCLYVKMLLKFLGDEKILIAILMICLSGASFTTIGGSECCAWVTGGDPPYLVISRNVVTGSSASAVKSVQGSLFVRPGTISNGEYIGEESYYGDIYTVRDVVCGSIS
jgi:hypothetical protein